MLNERQRVVLAYLNMGRMEATARMIGEELKLHGSAIVSAGGVIAGLRIRGFIYYLDDLRAWRITKAGRAALAAK